MAWWKPDRLDPGVRDSLREALGSKPQILDWGRSGEEGYCVMLPGTLAYLTGAGAEWTLVPWHTIERGEWNTDTQSLRCELTDGRRINIALDRAGELPLLFRDRVNASIVVDEFVEIPQTRNGGRVTARRDLTDRDASIIWRTVRSRGTPDRPEVNAILEERLVQLKGVFD